MFEIGDLVYIPSRFQTGTVKSVGDGTYDIFLCDKSGCRTITFNANALEAAIRTPPVSNATAFKKEEDYLDHLREKETVAKPTRYNSGSIEVWDAIQQLGADYLQGNVIKYTMRYKHKNKAEDLKKAMNYLAKMLAEETGEDYYELRKKSLDEL